MADLQSKTLLAAVESQQLTTATSGRLYFTAESRIEENEHGAWQKVNENDAEPEVDVEVDVHVLGDELNEVDLTADDRRVGIDVGRQLKTLDTHLDEPCQL